MGGAVRMEGMREAVTDAGRELQMWRRRWNPSIRRSQSWSAQAWDLRSWRHLWMVQVVSELGKGTSVWMRKSVQEG